MKQTLIVAMLMTSAVAFAQNIKLPAPDQSEKSLSVVEALGSRHSVREYADKELSNQQISNLCWAACGVSRDAEHRTSPTAMNKKEIRLYVVKKDGAYEYDAPSNTLILKAKGDHRSLVAGGSAFKQDFVLQAPLSLVMVIDFEKFGSDNEHSRLMGCVDAGNVSENVNLYCQAVGLATVPRTSMDTDGLRKVLGLSEKQLPIMNNPVGFPKK